MSRNKNTLTFWLIWLVGVVPMLVAFMMYYSGFLRPENTINQGELIAQQTLKQWQLKYNDNAWQQTSQWQILHTLPNSCNSTACENWQNNLPTLIKLLGKDSSRVAYFQVGTKLDMLQTPKIETLGEAVWVVDPLGNLVMRYSPQLQPKQLLKDLKKLLKLSGVG